MNESRLRRLSQGSCALPCTRKYDRTKARSEAVWCCGKACINGRCFGEYLNEGELNIDALGR